MKTAHPSVPATTLLKFTSSLLLLWFLSFAMYVDAQSLNWRQIPGSALDIAVGANGTVWAIGYDAGKTDHSIYRFNGSNFERVPGAAVRIAVDPQGNAWVANSAGDIYRSEGNTFRPVPGRATDIGIGANGAVWVVGINPAPGGYGIYRWNGSAFVGMPGAAIRISVDPQGNPWVINSAKNIYRFDGSGYVQLPGTANDIGIGGDGSVFISGTDDAVYKWNGTSAWVKLDGNGLIAIAADGTGNPWGVNAGRNIYAGTNVSVRGNVPLATKIRTYEDVRIANFSVGKQELLYNGYPTNHVWFTVYNDIGRQEDYGCIAPNSYSYTRFPLSAIGTSKILFEVKNGPGCGGSNACATNSAIQSFFVEAAQSIGAIASGASAPVKKFPLLRKNGSNCYIDWPNTPDPLAPAENEVYNASFVNITR